LLIAQHLKIPQEQIEESKQQLVPAAQSVEIQKIATPKSNNKKERTTTGKNATPAAPGAKGGGAAATVKGGASTSSANGAKGGGGPTPVQVTPGGTSTTLASGGPVAKRTLERRQGVNGSGFHDPNADNVKKAKNIGTTAETEVDIYAGLIPGQSQEQHGQFLLGAAASAAARTGNEEETVMGS